MFCKVLHVSLVTTRDVFSIEIDILILFTDSLVGKQSGINFSFFALFLRLLFLLFLGGSVFFLLGFLFFFSRLIFFVLVLSSRTFFILEELGVESEQSST